MPHRIGRWSALLLAALNAEPIVLVRAVLEDHLGRAPSRAELTACRRAAHHLAATGRAQVAHLPAQGWYEGTGSLVVARTDADVDEVELRQAGRRAATSLAPTAGPSAEDEPSDADVTALAVALVAAVGEAVTGLRQAQAYRVPPAVAGTLAADLADVGVEVARLRRQLQRRAQDPVHD